ncbi:GNAT family N-acetyltransferase [Caldibacillus lycopersici]|uniref:GNAT family N-acetyltransferase n=1 Tax=Perspicuibacillus lycopersici TaxID=1325689 RepID=A0AAE3LSB7_9BACI|nr:GNAT family N-acetyltransferase [Perspicuibacillus lycopersici]MCU9612568.1 GNAT family N-acetyltransferase [Perspicuibacillus lycopersici]
MGLEFTDIPVLETENYRLRGVTIGDAADLFMFMRDSDTMKFITPHLVKTVEEMEEKINNHLQNFLQSKEIPWVIITKETDKVIGMVRFHKLHLWHRKTEIGVAICKEYQGKGVMTEVMKELLRFGFLELKLNRIVGDIFAENIGSKKLLEKFGFHQDGILRQTDFDGVEYHDTIVYSMLKQEYVETKR